MKALLVGAGIAGFLHSLAYRAHGVSIAGIFDPDLRRAHDLAELCGGVAVSSFDELAGMDAEVVSICSPPRAHVEQAERLGQGGRAVLVEKPVAVSLDELVRLRAVPRCIPVVQWRAGRAIRAVRRAVAQGELGDAPVVSCELAWSRDEGYVRSRGEAWGCGAVLSIGIHAIDALSWAIGRKVEHVSGFTTRRDGAWGETGAVGLLRFEGGALASLRISLDGGADVTRIGFCGRGITATIEGAEGDPTASTVRWVAARGPGAHARVQSLEALERETPGSLGSPLLVPYIGDAVAALREGLWPGASERLLSIADCFEAHQTALRITHASCDSQDASTGRSRSVDDEAA